jgi:hypothetical protein
MSCQDSGLSGRRRAKAGGRLKRLAALLLAGFLAFAPPGTILFALALIAGFAGRGWLAVVVGVGLAAGAALLLLRRRRAPSKPDPPEHPD